MFGCDQCMERLLSGGNFETRKIEATLNGIMTSHPQSNRNSLLDYGEETGRMFFLNERRCKLISTYTYNYLIGKED